MRLLIVALLALVAVAAAARARSIPRLGADAITCDICSWIVEGAEKQLENNSTEQEIVAELDKACSVFGPFSSVCQSLVAQYVPQIIALLEQKVPVETICQKIGLCPVPTTTTAAASAQAAATTSHAAATTTRSAAGVTASSSGHQASSGNQASSGASNGGGSSGGSSGGSGGSGSSGDARRQRPSRFAGRRQQ